MKKRIGWVLTFIVIAVGAFAIPAKRTPFTVTNSDGTVLTLIMCGDESYHFYTTTDGIPVVMQENGDYRLAPELKDEITSTWTRRSKRRSAHRTRRAMKHLEYDYDNYFKGTKKGIVILVNFKNLSMKSANTNDAFYAQFNEQGYSKNNHYGSVHDYFYDQSYGQLDLTFDVFGPVTVSQNYAYYGGNNSEGVDKRPAKLAAEACKLADQKYDINWADYDWDGDKEVDQVYIIYAGYGENAGASTSTIWPHEWTLSDGVNYGDGDGAITLDGCTIDTYAMSCELRGTSGSTMNGMGTACHEFSHCLGFPDYYDTSYEGGFGMSYWDVMDGGSYSGASGWGEQPCGFTSHERMMAGWLTPTELSSPAVVTDMPALQDEPVAYIILNDGNENEYFLLENRQNKGWFQYVGASNMCHGMLVIHVDYDEDAWYNNEPNIEAKHQRMSIIPANKTFGTLKGASGDKQWETTPTQLRGQLFPGYNGVDELTDESHPSHGVRLFNKNTDGSYLMQKPITGIAESADGLISFNFMGGSDDVTPKPGPSNKITIKDIADLIEEYLNQTDE
jgi:M6 family metalloprotease-like protein